MRRLLENHRQPATAVTSFALVAPLFFLLIFGTMEIGRVFSTWLVITNEAREAARYGAVRYGTANLSAQVTNHVQQRLQGVLSPTGLTPAPQVVVGNRRVEVTVYYQVDLVIPLVSRILPDPFPLVARSVMQGE